MFKCDRSDQRSVKARRVCCISERRFLSRRADVSACTDQQGRKMQTEKQIGLRFAKHFAARNMNGDTLMKYRTIAAGSFSRSLIGIGAGLAGLLMMGSAASAQSTSWYVSPNQTPVYDGLTSLNSVITSAPLWNSLPLSFTIGSTSGQISFSGSSVVARGGAVLDASGATSTSNYVSASNGSVTFDFATQQRFFSMRWGSVDGSNILSFYNGNQLLQSVTGAQAMAARTAWTPTASYDAGFSFGEVGFTRVVATGSPGASFELANVAVSSAVDVAPIPLGGVGGIVALLGMFALRQGQGGRLPQRLLAFASGARRQQVQRFA